MKTAQELDAFTRSYIESLLWLGISETDDGESEPADLRGTFDAEDLDAKDLATIREECQRFQRENAFSLRAYCLAIDRKESREQWSPIERAGLDFSLCRNGHGSGFWDRGIGRVGERLSKAARKYGERTAYLMPEGRVVVE